MLKYPHMWVFFLIFSISLIGGIFHVPIESDKIQHIFRFYRIVHQQYKKE